MDIKNIYDAVIFTSAALSMLRMEVAYAGEPDSDVAQSA